MITLYTNQDCTACIAAKKFLENRNKQFTIIDIDKDENARARIAELGYKTLPVIETMDTHFSGFYPDKLIAL